MNEAGLYSLVLQSKLPFAREFKRWIVKDVLKNIRKNGNYCLSNTKQCFSRQLCFKIMDERDLHIKVISYIRNKHPNAILCNYMSIYIGNDLEDRLEALEMENTSLKKYNLEDRLKALETENAVLKKYNEYHKVVHEIDYMSDMHSSFYKQSMKIDKYFKIKEWHDSSISDPTIG